MMFIGSINENTCERVANKFTSPFATTFLTHAFRDIFIQKKGLTTSPASGKLAVHAANLFTGGFVERFNTDSTRHLR
jgi:hypothetical protein